MTVLSDKYENGSLFFGTQRGITCSETPYHEHIWSKDLIWHRL
ncbi:unnamed protein product [Penicillium roqueforti FM164]|uniref:Genomic scaffold, ProqFM164S01 n=1 Tax=Penicillium roqueforti (strain FM164) TaxID=1365484 RepID=W6PRH9_PENRF|nr:unnamed protein product [Penicillium roqueforti FM164]